MPATTRKLLTPTYALSPEDAAHKISCRKVYDPTDLFNAGMDAMPEGARPWRVRIRDRFNARPVLISAPPRRPCNVAAARLQTLLRSKPPCLVDSRYPRCTVSGKDKGICPVSLLFGAMVALLTWTRQLVQIATSVRGTGMARPCRGIAHSGTRTARRDLSSLITPTGAGAKHRDRA